MIRLKFTGLLLVTLASCASAFAREPARMVTDARAIRNESPQLFSSAEIQAPVTGPLLLQVAPLAPQAYTPLRGACENSASSLCFDPVDRRIVFRPARQYMPTLDGFTAEGISLRRDAIRFKYSFK